ncbi:hypothetical protein BJX62DRAFT_228877 [Aspergillus germanicus]
MTATATATALSQLRSLFPNAPNKVVTPALVDQYKTAVTVPWSQTCWTPAAAYMYLDTTGARFAIRTTGHNPNLNSRELISTNGDRNHRETIARGLGLSAIGERDPEAGLGGFLLGGMGAFPKLHGLGADAVRNFQALLADGNLINANAEENGDLYRALKGGGWNFGFPPSLIKVQYNINLHDPEDHDAINQATVAVQHAMEEDRKIGMFTNFNNGFVAVGSLYAGHPAEPPRDLEPFRNLKSLVTTAVPVTSGTILSLAEVLSHDPAPLRRSICTTSTLISHELYEDVYGAWVEVCKTLPTGIVLHYTIQHLGKAGVQAGKDSGGYIMGYESVPQTSDHSTNSRWIIACEWPKDDSGNSDVAAQKAVETMCKTIESLAEARGVLLECKCMNFARGSQKVLVSYGAENVKRMQEVAAKYDLEGIFQTLQNGGFLPRDIL